MRSPRRGKAHGEGETPDFRTIQTLHNHFPNHPATAFQPCANHREPQPIFIRPSTATQPRDNHSHASFVLQSHSSRQTDDSALGKHPRLNHPSCRIQERFRHNRPTSTILESTTLSCMALARQSTALSKSEDSHLHLKVMIWYNTLRQWRKPKSPAGGEVSADGEEKSSPLTLKTMCGDE